MDIQDKRHVARSKAMQAMRALLDYMELEDMCEGDSKMKELMTTTDIMAEFKCERTLAGEVMRAVGFSTGKRQRARRGDVIAFWMHGKPDLEIGEIV